MSKLAILIVAFLTVCLSGKSETNNTNCYQTETVESFDVFKAKFYSDREFQFSRMKFPLKGGEVGGVDYIPSDIEESKETNESVDTKRTEWKLEDFSGMLKGIEKYPNHYKSELTKTETKVTEKIYLPESGYYEIREFELIGEKWYLVYFFLNNI